MDKLTSLNLTFDRVLIQFVIPGAIASYPFIILFLHVRPDTLNFFLVDGKSIFIIFLSFMFLISGIFLDNLAARIEVHLYDYCQKKIHKSIYMDTWYKYLKLRFDIEPIGQRYLRNVLLRMKFELSMACALLLMEI